MNLVVYQKAFGSEFIGNVKKRKEGAFEIVTKREFNVIHERIPPCLPNYNSDVETFHKMIENDLYEVEKFNSIQ